MRSRRLRAWVSLGLLLAGFVGLAFAPAGADDRQVVIVPISGLVDAGMAHLVERSVAEADAKGAAAIVLDINSPGGLPDAAYRIRDVLSSAHEPVIAYVDPRAYSVAALIALAANRIVMAPGASIGDAEPDPASVAAVSSMRGEFESAALRNHRSAAIAGAMVDKNVDLPDYKRSGAILTLNTEDAQRARIADATAPTLDAALAQSNLGDAARTTEGYTWGEQLARFATNRAMSGLLLTLGMLGLLIEMQTMHGIAGIVGITALALFFGTHVYAGFSNGFVIALALLGLIGIVWELHVVPGHGVPGILGGAALLLAVLLAFGIPFFFVAVETVATAIVLSVIGFTLATRAFPENAWVNRMALAAAQGPDYVTSGDFTDLRGQIGTAASFLRPAGIAAIGGRRIDVLTEGEFIPQGTTIRVARVEGSRIFVEAVDLPSFK